MTMLIDTLIDDKKRDKEKGAADKDKKRQFSRRKVCRFCADPGLELDYKNAVVLRGFLSERGRIVPRRITGNCAKHQRALGRAVKQARMIAILPFAVTGK